MPYFTAHDFMKKHGGESGLEKFIQICNEFDKNLKEIGKRFNLSPSQVCRLRKRLLKRQWVPVRGTLEAIESRRDQYREELERIDNYVKEQHVKSNCLKFVSGAKWK